MKTQLHSRPSVILALIAGIAAVLGICHYYQWVSSKPIFPIDKSTLTITHLAQPGNSAI